ncbi:hypothetical protein LIER_41779 [Lithospermum erythrorhizon]|uniref:Retroviral polymerase SH3-like domain-containing protein n=1 Tax=Lithospermum erythrorhizon TaxID=34254 RepID=A0AAV3RHC5_LITER
MTGEYSFKSWILDSGASHHVTGNQYCLTDIRTLFPCPIGLPNGHSSMATMEGHDQRSLSLIGASERHEGLYYYRTIPTVCTVTVPGLSYILQDKSPYEILLGKPLELDHLRVFGCLFYAHDQRSKGDKFASRSRRCAFVGYPKNQRGWKLYDMDSGAFFVSRDVRFHENEYPFVATTSVPKVSVPGSSLQHTVEEELANSLHNNNDDDLPNDDDDLDHGHLATNHDTLNCENIQPHGEVVDLRSAHTHDHTVPIQPTTSLCSAQPTPANQYAPASTCTSLSSPQHGQTRMHSSSGSLYPLAHYVNCDSFSLLYRIFLAAVVIGVEPLNFREAMADPRWRETMNKEIAALEANNT